ncbi:MAG: methylated-DNA--[protein]-cysteine S-methyltransferase [Nitrososphaerota archaeon]|nr:methylated-DNA--[protein]-cysteine S-methyltransferase [Candidatus Calditenuaceae archaeon]MDW8072905.1 methylated-DNA--[protein]-cysteine S-methyltransferase [Nitrososphaerota archaeon]
MRGAIIHSIDSWLGRIEIAVVGEHLVYVGIGLGGAASFLGRVRLRDSASAFDRVLIEEAEAQLTEYLHGERRVFTLPLKFLGTFFQTKVWLKTMEIPYGETRSYSWVAGEIGSNSPRPVGGALAANHLMIIVPCHRVVGAHGKLGGFSAGMSVKKRLLEHEARYSC